MTTTDTYQTSGTSPPPAGAHSPVFSTPSEPPPIPEELIEALAVLLAEALVADIRQYPTLAEVEPSQAPTVESPSGLDRQSRPARSRASIANRWPAVGRQTE